MNLSNTKTGNIAQAVQNALKPVEMNLGISFRIVRSSYLRDEITLRLEGKLIEQQQEVLKEVS
jgi:hypothetical protein